MIRGFKKDDGSRMTKRNDVINVLIGFYEKPFTTEGSDDTRVAVDEVQTMMTSKINDLLLRSCTTKEI